MSATIQLVAPPELLFQPPEKKSLFRNRETKPIRLSPLCEPEQRLWKLSARAASPTFAMIELSVLVLFLVFALIAVVSCFAELSHLLDSDAVGHLAAKAISVRM
jgi:hypothetical protein